MFRLKSLNNVCFRYEVDLWKSAMFTPRLTRLNLMFVRKRLDSLEQQSLKSSASLRIDVLKPMSQRRRLSAYGQFMETRKKICYIQGGLSKRSYRKLNKSALRMGGDFSRNMLYLLECRLCMTVYRLGFAKNIFESIQLIYAGLIIVNKKVICSPDHSVPLGEVVELNFPVKEKKHKELCDFIAEGKRMLLQVAYCEVNFPIMGGIVFRAPFFSEVPFFFSFNPGFFYSEYAGKY
jgi:ribosomal protein S4